MTGPYKFGDVVDGYRWTVLGWEQVEGTDASASAALRHAMDTRIETASTPPPARHTSTAARAQAQVDTRPTQAPAEDPPPVVADPAVATEAAAETLTTPGGDELRWTAVGWEVVPPTEQAAAADSLATAEVEPPAAATPVVSVDPPEEFADVLAAAPSAPPLEADLVGDDAALDAPVVDLREVSIERAVTLPEPTAGWYPG